MRHHEKSSGFCGAEEENGGRGTDSPGGRHPNRTNGNLGGYINDLHWATLPLLGPLKLNQ